MPTKAADAHTDFDKAALSPEEWNFDSVIGSEEEEVCMVWELLRESAFVRAAAAMAIKCYRDTAMKTGCDDPQIIELPSGEEFCDTCFASTSWNTPVHLQVLAFMAMAGFPKRPWRNLKDSFSKWGLANILRMLITLPRHLKLTGEIEAAATEIKLVRDDGLRDALQQKGYDTSLALYGFSHPQSGKQMLTVAIDPDADDALIKESIRTKLAALRKQTGVIKEAKGGRKPNHLHPQEVLKAIGLIRLAYHTSGKRAWKKLYPGSAPTDANIRIKRARETCVAAMHAHFELPETEKPLHHRRRKTAITKTHR